MKIKVILTETIKGIGKKDEIIEVKDGYANNFLLKEIVLKVKAGENGKVFGSIGAKEISEAIKDQLNIEIDKKKISTSTRVKDLGLHTVELKLHSEVKGSIKVKVEAK